MKRHALHSPIPPSAKARSGKTRYRPAIEILEDRLTPTTLLPGFIDVPVASGIIGPTAMEFSPDGRLWVLEQTGNVKLVRNDGTTFTAVDLNVDSAGERGLLGIAFDPNFASNHFVYLYYTNPNPGTAPWATGVHNQISRFTVNDTDPLQPTLTNEAGILDVHNLISATNHNGGAIHFGLDGTLYANIGDNVQNFTGPDSISYRVSQTLANLHGKQLRIDVSKFNSGAATRNDTDVGDLIPVNNPFVGQATGINQLIYVLGLRNPFTFAVQPGTGRILINDVGETTWEEINDAIPGANYGWRGGSSDGFGHPPPAFAPGPYHEPLLAYAHGGTASLATGFAIVGSTFYNPATVQFPDSYVGMYFYQDLATRWIRYFNPNNPNSAATPDGNSVEFASNTPGGLRDLKVDNAGNLYYLSGGDGAVHRISYVAPKIIGQPTNQTATQGQPANFSVTATGPALNYQWQHLIGSTWTNVGADSATFTIAAATTSDVGSYRVIVTNTFGSATSDTATLTVNAPDNLVVNSIAQTSTGFTAHFNRPFEPSVINLFDGLGTFGSADVTLVNAASPTVNIRGSLLIDPTAMSFTFVRTGTGSAGILPAGNYIVTIRSASDGFKDAIGGLLDGNNDGTSGDNHVVGFIVGATPAVILSVPDFARGPDSASTIKIPNNTGASIPITLDGASGVTNVTFDLHYNPALLSITGTVNPATGTFTLVSNLGGVASFAFQSGTGLTGNETLGQIVAAVPDNAASTYKASELLDLTDILINGGSISAADNDGLHVAAYLADTFGDGSISGGDASLIGRVAIGLDTGFRAYRLVDPGFLGDFNANGFSDSTDFTMLMLRLVGGSIPQIPEPPVGVMSPSAPGIPSGISNITASQAATNSDAIISDSIAAEADFIPVTAEKATTAGDRELGFFAADTHFPRGSTTTYNNALDSTRLHTVAARTLHSALETTGTQAGAVFGRGGTPVRLTNGLGKFLKLVSIHDEGDLSGVVAELVRKGWAAT